MNVDLSSAKWRKSTHSDGGGGCIEVADGYPGIMPVRDSKDPNGPALFFSFEAWTAFAKATVDGEFGDV
ncbi:DUF397 domain-containing protein [Kitasatospora sp. NPDC056783]|uniref:DUF397 domain-containing protein n=1 Tax=Kitasatospora sp. NPDC056783 TaxID=3345943 RepID=UPI003677111F